MIEVKRTVVLDVSCRKVEEDGVVIRCHVLGNRIVDSTAHKRVVFTIGELPDNKAFDASQDARHTEIVHHAVDVVMALADVFDEEDDAIGMCIDNMIKVIRRALQAVENAEVASDECAFGLS